MKKQASKPKNWVRYYDDRNILDESTDGPVDMLLDEHLRDDILSGKRKRKLKNVTIKVDPLQVKEMQVNLGQKGLSSSIHTKLDLGQGCQVSATKFDPLCRGCSLKGLSFTGIGLHL